LTVLKGTLVQIQIDVDKMEELKGHMPREARGHFDDPGSLGIKKLEILGGKYGAGT
jgi:hypothetical protein